MAVLDILVYPDPRLREIAEPVVRVDDNIRTLVDDMAETMYQAPGIGLAAVQVKVPKRVIVIDLSKDQSELQVFIDPQIVERDGSQEIEEGCLSVPDVFAPVQRAESILVTALNRDGDRFELRADGLLSVCIQHEMDHLDGKVFVDYLSRLKQERIRKRLQKQAKRTVHEAPVRDAIAL
jgi:peptide deformylase